MQHLFFEILILSGVATFIVSLCGRLKLPSMLGFIFTGIIIGPGGLGVVRNLLDAKAIVEIVGVLLMFTIGLEFSRGRLSELRNQLLKLGPLQVVSTTFVTTSGLLLFTDMNWQQSLTWGMLISLSSTAQVLKILHDSRDNHSPYAQNSLGILLFQDIAVIPMLILLPLLAETSSTEISFASSVIPITSAVIVVALTWTVGRYILPKALSILVSGQSQDLLFFAFLFVLLTVAGVFHSAGISASLGAFIAGFLIAETDFGHQATSVFLIVRDTLLGLFFASIGAMVEPQFVLDHAGTIFLLGLVGFFVKAVTLFCVCKIQRATFATASITAILLAQVGEFSFVMAARATELGILSATDTQYFLSLTVSSMIATPFLYKLAPSFAHFRHGDMWRDIFSRQFALRRTAKNQAQIEVKNADTPFVFGKDQIRPTLIIGFGVAGQNVCHALTSLALPVSVVDSNYDQIKKHRRSGRHLFFGDATDKEILHRAGLMEAGLVVITVSSANAIPRILGVIRAERPDIRVIVRVQFVQDARNIQIDENMQLVVAEVETTMELVSASLSFYGADEGVRSELMKNVRTDARNWQTIGMESDLVTSRATIPNWSSAALLMPHRILANDFAINKTLAELQLPALTGGSVAMIFRPGLGTTVARGDFVLSEGDVLQLLASQEQTPKLIKFLRLGQLV
jgi:CPA2 family monovalent cation:H+ antiporter-2